MSSQIDCKVYSNKEIRRFIINNTLDFSAFLQLINNLFHETPKQIYYIDEDGDVITCTTNIEFSAALWQFSNSKKPHFRIFLDKNRIEKYIQENMSNEMSDVTIGTSSSNVPFQEMFGFRKRERQDCELVQNKRARIGCKKEKMNTDDVILESYDPSCFPKEINSLYLDCNNMLFIYSITRKLALRRKRNEADAILCKLWELFHKKMKLKKTVVVFDDTKLETGNKDGFEVVCARPQFKTSDDALVEFAKAGKGDCLFVTSDIQLTKRLREVGGKVIKPGRMIKYAMAVINGEEVKNRNEWLSKLCELNT